jgi:hypothetical protein
MQIGHCALRCASAAIGDEEGCAAWLRATPFCARAACTRARLLAANPFGCKHEAEGGGLGSAGETAPLPEAATSHAAATSLLGAECGHQLRANPVTPSGVLGAAFRPRSMVALEGLDESRQSCFLVATSICRPCRAQTCSARNSRPSHLSTRVSQSRTSTSAAANEHRTLAIRADVSSRCPVARAAIPYVGRASPGSCCR